MTVVYLQLFEARSCEVIGLDLGPSASGVDPSGDSIAGLLPQQLPLPQLVKVRCLVDTPVEACIHQRNPSAGVLGGQQHSAVDTDGLIVAWWAMFVGPHASAFVDLVTQLWFPGTRFVEKCMLLAYAVDGVHRGVVDCRNSYPSLPAHSSRVVLSTADGASALILSLVNTPNCRCSHGRVFNSPNKTNEAADVIAEPLMSHNSDPTRLLELSL